MYSETAGLPNKNKEPLHPCGEKKRSADVECRRVTFTDAGKGQDGLVAISLG